jgi:uncharacterized membrane protein YbhN (UPF0104 family)
MAATPNPASDPPDEFEAPTARGSRLITALKLALAVALVAGLFHYEVIDAGQLIGVLSDPAKSVPSLAMLFAAFILGGVRWYLILRTFGIFLGLRSVFEIYAIGTFFNGFLPGATGGDVMRVVYVLRSVPKRKLRTVASVFADRVVGLYGLLMMSMGLIALRSDTVFGSAETRLFGLGLVAMFGAITLGGTVLLLAANALRSSDLARTWQGGTGWRRLARMSLELVLTFRNALPVLGASVLISLMMSGLIVGSVVWLATSYGAAGLDSLEFACAAALASLAGAVPLTPGGIGLAEGAFAYICALWVGAGAGFAFGTIFLGNRLLQLVLSLVCAIGFVTHRPASAA